MKTLNATLLATLLATAVGGAFAQTGASTTTTTTTTVRSPLVTSTDTKDPTRSDAVDKCAQASGSSKTGCLVDSKGNVTTVGTKTENAAHKTKEVAQTAVDKTKAVASTVAQKTENMIDRAGDKTRAATSSTSGSTERAADKTAAVASDSVITTKVKASIFGEPELKSMDIHVETEKGVVMLSGFVNSKAEADKAVTAAKSVEGVTNVKSAIKVK
ncbi:BON domain-containing protein [Massilia sp. S19_KUP03_FR1]|uniref:BON domain-containing protein n=1 Tax=Massilia sp. S19_KUP03_FR1 TaxID=3025503 RepID=UPI002FCD9737